MGIGVVQKLVYAWFDHRRRSVDGRCVGTRKGSGLAMGEQRL
jgi:hypothetical protein